jgi:hypothetical protein
MVESGSVIRDKTSRICNTASIYIVVRLSYAVVIVFLTMKSVEFLNQPLHG